MLPKILVKPASGKATVAILLFITTIIFAVMNLHLIVAGLTGGIQPVKDLLEMGEAVQEQFNLNLVRTGVMRTDEQKLVIISVPSGSYWYRYPNPFDWLSSRDRMLIVAKFAHVNLKHIDDLDGIRIYITTGLFWSRSDTYYQFHISELRSGMKAHAAGNEKMWYK